MSVPDASLHVCICAPLCGGAGEVKEVKASGKGEDVHEPPMRRKKERLDTPMQGSDQWV